MIIIAVSFVLERFSELKAVKFAFFGIRAGVLALIIKALWSMYKQCPKNISAYIIMAASFVLAAFLNVNILAVIIGCAAFGLVSSLVAGRKMK